MMRRKWTGPRQNREHERIGAQRLKDGPRWLVEPTATQVSRLTLEDLYEARRYGDPAGESTALIQSRIRHLEQSAPPVGTSAKGARWAVGASCLAILVSALAFAKRLRWR